MSKEDAAFYACCMAIIFADKKQGSPTAISQLNRLFRHHYTTPHKMTMVKEDFLFLYHQQTASGLDPSEALTVANNAKTDGHSTQTNQKANFIEAMRKDPNWPSKVDHLAPIAKHTVANRQLSLLLGMVKTPPLEYTLATSNNEETFEKDRRIINSKNALREANDRDYDSILNNAPKILGDYMDREHFPTAKRVNFNREFLALLQGGRTDAISTDMSPIHLPRMLELLVIHTTDLYFLPKYSWIEACLSAETNISISESSNWAPLTKAMQSWYTIAPYITRNKLFVCPFAAIILAKKESTDIGDESDIEGHMRKFKKELCYLSDRGSKNSLHYYV